MRRKNESVAGVVLVVVLATAAAKDSLALDAIYPVTLPSPAHQPSPFVRQGGLKYQRLAARPLKDDPSALNRPNYDRP